MSHLRVLCVQSGAEWDYDDEIQGCTDGMHEHVPVERDGHALNLNERLADTPL